MESEIMNITVKNDHTGCATLCMKSTLNASGFTMKYTLEYPQCMLKFFILSFCLISYSLAILVPDNCLPPLAGIIVTISTARNYHDSSGQNLSAYLPRFSFWTHLHTISVPTTTPRLAEGVSPRKGKVEALTLFPDASFAATLADGASGACLPNMA